MDSVVRPAKEEDIAELTEFFKKEYRPEHIMANRDYLAWQYRNISANQFYPDYSNLLFFYGKEIVGHLGMIPYFFNINGQKMRVAYLASGIVKKDLRGVGAGALLIKEAEKYFDILYTMGFNKQIAPIYKFGGWSEEQFLKRWVFKCPKNSAEKRAENIEEINFFSEDWDVLWKDITRTFAIAINRDSKYLNWRFTNHPFAKYKIFGVKHEDRVGGYIVLRKEVGKELSAYRIVDFISREETARELLWAAINLAREEGVDFLDFLCNAPIHQGAFEDAGFKLTEESDLDPVPLFILPIDPNRRKINFSYKFINPFLKDLKTDDWLVVKSDGDKDRVW